jgi:hypothetical protein
MGIPAGMRLYLCPSLGILMYTNPAMRVRYPRVPILMGKIVILSVLRLTLVWDAPSTCKSCLI